MPPIGELMEGNYHCAKPSLTAFSGITGDVRFAGKRLLIMPGSVPPGRGVNHGYHRGPFSGKIIILQGIDARRGAAVFSISPPVIMIAPYRSFFPEPGKPVKIWQCPSSLEPGNITGNQDQIFRPQSAVLAILSSAFILAQRCPSVCYCYCMGYKSQGKGHCPHRLSHLLFTGQVR